MTGIGHLGICSSEQNPISVFKEFSVDCSVVNASKKGNCKVMEEIIIRILSPEWQWR